MTKQQFEWIIAHLHLYAFTSLHYVEFEDIKDFQILQHDDKCIVIYGFNVENNLYEYHWASQTAEALLEILHLNTTDIYKITFIPKQWVTIFELNGLTIYGVWHDYTAYHIQSFNANHHIIALKEESAEEASQVTQSCNFQTRGFTGQTTEWMKQWISNPPPNTLQDTSHHAVFGYNEKELSGIVCVAIYGDVNNKTLWIREIAVKPDHQGRGIGRALLEHAFTYGTTLAASKAFLMVDDSNSHAIKLYEKMGFKPTFDDGQIDMIKKLPLPN